MSFNNIDGQNLGKFLQIAFSKGLRNQLSNDHRDYQYVQQCRVGNPDGRELRFLFQQSYGTSAIQYRDPNFTANFPAAQQITTSEHTAVWKELDITIELEYNLWKRAQLAPSKYAEPLAKEMESKMIAAKRRIAADLYGDGSGVVGEVASTTSSGGELTVTLSSANGAFGHVGFFEYGDILVAKEQDGTDSVGDAVFWKVVSKNRRANSVVLQSIDTTTLADNGSITTPPAAGEVFYRYGQPSFADLGSVADWGSATAVMPGLESLAASDGRTIYGITMSGATGATTLDANNDPIDVSLIEELMNDVKINVGRSSYGWKMMVCAPEVRASFLESRETDRRFQSVDDATRGAKKFCYQHEDDLLELYSSEYCPKKRIYCLPEAKSSEKVLELHMTDFETVKANDMNAFHLKPGASGGHERRIVTYMESVGSLICKHPAAIAKLENFSF